MTRMIGLTLTVLIASAALADDPARLAPADAGVYVEIHDLDMLRQQWRDDPIVQRIKQRLPAHRNPEAWRFIEQALDMTGEQIFDAYFSRQIVVIAQRAGDGEPAVILTRIDPADGQRLIDALVLSKTARAGEFDLYEPEDRGSRLAFAGEWFAIADERHEPFMLRVLESIGGDAQLADDPQYRQWMDRLPGERQATAFVRGDGGVHAMALTSSTDAFSLHYAGTSHRFAPLLAKLGDAPSLGRGPAPADALLVAALNLHDPHPRQAPFIDRLIAPHTFEHDVAPALGAPLVVWLAAASGEPDAAPVAGAAVRLRDHKAADVLDLAMTNALVLVNVGAMQWGLPPLSAVQKEADGDAYHVVPFHDALPPRAHLPLLRGADLAFGRAGDWYVVTTREQAYLDARRAAGPPAPEADDARRPIAHLELRGRLLADRLKALHDSLPPRRPAMGNARDRILAAIPWLERYDTARVEMDADGDDVIYATLDATR